MIVTLASDFPFGVVKLIPFTVHGWIERMVGPLLVAMPFILNFSDEEVARNFYIAIGIVIIVIGMLTDYRAEVRVRKVE
ncbi:hypothetical protein [Nitrosomonas oligotropha]|nr:hypothetical protein [Nitrosomonas oligotropha]